MTIKWFYPVFLHAKNASTTGEIQSGSVHLICPYVLLQYSCPYFHPPFFYIFPYFIFVRP